MHDKTKVIKMRKVIYSLMVSLDGFIETTDHQLDWCIVDEELHSYVNEQERAMGAHVYGRRMYEVMSYWQTADTDTTTPAYEREYARIWQRIPKLVFSTTLEGVGPNARLARGNIAEEIGALKAQPGRDIAVGGASIAASLMQLGLVDEYQLYVQPVVLGSGTPAFPTPAARASLQLVRARTFASGVVELRYERANT